MSVIKQLVCIPIKGWFNKGFWPFAFGYWLKRSRLAAFSRSMTNETRTSNDKSIAYSALPMANNQQPIALQNWNMGINTNTTRI